ncbi:MAG: NADH-quinone oxidoreductase subunit A [Caldisphaera sp.]|nr:NADH-quinone oxidoreductase subunit A [Caldisphaera sp.]PMP61078.1 MAG: NADH-quinone oxidoreductase subunit A [Caldisphaera sp.]
MSIAYNPLVLAANAMIIVPILVLLLLVAVIYLLKWLLKASYEIEKTEPYKKVPFESSNPPKGVGKGRMTFQYFGYLIMFLAMEPAVVLLTFIAVSPKELISKTILLYLVLILVFAPLLAYAAYEAKRVKNWMFG